jgi:hypothetical protein
MKNFIKKHVDAISFGIASIFVISSFVGLRLEVKAMGLEGINERVQVVRIERVEEETAEETSAETEVYIPEESTEAETEVVSPETTIVETEYYDVPLSRTLQDYIFELCEERDIEPALVIAIIERESKYEADTIGDSGDSLGLMQIQPKWHSERMTRLGAKDLLNPFDNVLVGIDILDELIDSGNSLEWALMAYNGGNAYAYRLVSEGVISEYATTVINTSITLTK